MSDVYMYDVDRPTELALVWNLEFEATATGHASTAPSMPQVRL